MKKNKYATPTVSIHSFSEECIAAGSAVTTTENALKNGTLKVNDQDVSEKSIVKVVF